MQPFVNGYNLGIEPSNRFKNGFEETVSVLFGSTLPNERQLSKQLQEGKAAFLVFDVVDGYADGLYIKPSGTEVLISYGWTTNLTDPLHITPSFCKNGLALHDLKLEEEKLVMSSKQFVREMKQLIVLLNKRT
jgi:hypothetical protein